MVYARRQHLINVYAWPHEGADRLNGLAVSTADKEKILWRDAGRFFELPVVA